MQKSLIIFLCVLATFVLIEGRPWYANYGYSSESGGGYDEGVRAYGEYGYNHGQSSVGGGGGRGRGGYGSGGRGAGRGGQRMGGHGGGGRPSYPSNNDRGYNYGYIPEDCPYCKIRSFGDGERGTNTFNLPKEAYV